MNSHDPLKILLIHVPFTSPTAVPLLPVMILSSLSEGNLRVSYYDANLDFFHKLIPDQTKECFPETIPEEVTGSAETAWRNLRSEAFYLPDLFVSGMDSVKNYFTLHPHLNSLFSNSWSTDFEGSLEEKNKDYKLITNDVKNLFSMYCRSGLMKRIKLFSPHICLISAPLPEQRRGALTLSRIGSEIRPKIPIILISSFFSEFISEFCDAVIEPHDMPALNAHIRKLGAQSTDKIDPMSKIKLLLSQEYAAPSTIIPLPFDETGRILKNTPSDFVKQFGVYNFFIPHTPRNTNRLDFLDKIPQSEGACRFALETVLVQEIETEIMHQAYQRGLRVVIWKNPDGAFKSLSKTLWNASEAGIWNHIVINESRSDLLMKELILFMISNPNIVHSWDYQDGTTYFFSDIHDLESSEYPYSQVKPLPGKPFWKCLSDPSHLFLYLIRYESQTLLRWRIRDDRKSIFSIGDHLLFNYKKPQDLPSGYLEEICKMVEAGGSVDTYWVRHNLERAFLIGYAEEEGVIVGNSSLKYPRKEYVESLGKQVGFDLSNYLERGYTSVRPEYRGMGIGTKLLEGLTARIGDKKLYSIISEDNTATQKIALRNRTQKVATFYSQKIGKNVGVWVPSWMIEIPAKKDHTSK
jgi:GNAT superfamily N-acetyltransferase